MKTLQILTFLVLTVVSSVSNKILPIPEYKIGDVIEDFNLKNVDGKMVSLADYKDVKGFIITFTCNTCPYAQMYEDRIIELDKKYAPLGYPVIAIMPNNTQVKPGDSFDEMKKRSQVKGYTFPYLIDEKQDVYPKFGATKTPHIYVVEKTKKGNVVQYIGAIDDNYKDASAVSRKYVEEAVDALLAGKKVKEQVTRAIGCSIKV